MKKYAYFLPHHWLGVHGFRRLFLVFFYADFLVLLYTFYHFALIWLAPAAQLAANSAPLRKLWTAALLQEMLIAVFLLLLIHLLGALFTLEQKTTKPRK